MLHQCPCGRIDSFIGLFGGTGEVAPYISVDVVSGFAISGFFSVLSSMYWRHLRVVWNPQMADAAVTPPTTSALIATIFPRCSRSWRWAGVSFEGGVPMPEDHEEAACTTGKHDVHHWKCVPIGTDRTIQRNHCRRVG